MSKRVLSLIMVFAMCFSLLPATVWADTTEITAEETQNVEDTDDALSVDEDTVDVLSVGEDAALQSGESGDAAVQASGHADHALCTHEGTCSCPEDAKNNAFTDAKPLTWRTTKKDGVDCSYLYIDGEEAEFAYSSGFWCCELPEGNYYLADDLTLSYAIQIKKNAKVNLCLNGYSITKTTDDNAPGYEGVIAIDGGGTFSLCDCKNSGKITHESGKFGRGVKISTSRVATFNMYGGAISGNQTGTSKQGQDGAGVYMAGGAFTMYGGKITDNHVKEVFNDGGGGMHAEKGTFTMYGGEISGNTSPKRGGGIFSKGSIIVKGGTISDNTAAENGGGVCVYFGTLKLSNDAVITGNTATGNGGGVYYWASSTSSNSVTVSGSAKIEKNKAANGGGIYVDEKGALTMSGGTVSDNTATGTGGGVYVNKDNDEGVGNATFTMTDGSVTGNSAQNGGGVYVGANGKFGISGGTITENKAENGAGVWTATALTVSGAPKIIDNTDNTDSTGNTKNNVYLGTASIIIGQGGMGASANIGVTTGQEDRIESGKYVTVGTGASNGYNEGNIFSDKGGDYVIKAEDDNINLYNGLPHEHPVIPGSTDESVTWKPIGSEDALRAVTGVTEGSCYYYLKDNITLQNTTWTPPDGMVLDLSGKNITANGAFDTITVNENVNFTLTDCKGGGEYYGAITHEINPASGPLKSKYNGRGVTVLAGGHFIMYDGNIGGNQNSDAGAGVYVATGAAFDMYGGEVAGNAVPASMQFSGGGIWTAGDTTIGGNAKIANNFAQMAGGVYVDSGTLTLAGNAKVTDNKAITHKHGIFVGAGGRLCVSGSVQVTGNTDNGIVSNVYLQENGNSVNPISVVGALTGARIDVSVPDAVLQSINDDHFVPIATANTEGWIQDDSFIGENDAAHNVIVSDNGKLAQLGTHLHDWEYTASSDGLSITAKCSNENCTSDGGSVTIVPPDESSLTYNGEEKAVTLTGTFKTGVVPEVTYEVKELGQQFAKLPEGSVPTNAGYYKAIITVGNVTAEAPYTIRQATPTADDFIITFPTDLVYDGNGKIATVKVRDGVVGMGDYEVMYFEYPKGKIDWIYVDIPTGVGAYTLGIRVKGTGNYAYTEKRLMDESNWVYTILPSTDYTVNVPESWTDAEKTIEVIEGSIFNTAIVAITQNYALTVTATGVNDEKIVGRVDWYTDEACTQPVDRTKMINETAGTTVKLYWKFTFLDDSQKKNYGITEDKIGSVDVIIKEGEKQDLAFYDAGGEKTTGSTAKYGGYPILIRAWNKTIDGGKVACESSEPRVATIDVDTDGDTTVTICGVGTTTITATADMVPGLYAKTTATYTLTVEKGVWGEGVTVAMQSYVYGSTPNAPSLFNYKGDDNDVTYYYGTTEDINSGEWTEWNLDNPPKLDAGDYYIHAKIKESAHYEAHTTTTASPFKVQKADPTCSAPAGLTARYGQKLSEIELPNSETNTPGTWNWMNGDEPVGAVSATAKIFKAKFTPDDTNNYKTMDNIDVAVTVNKAAAPAVDAVPLTVYNDVAKTYEIALPALPPLAADCEYGTIAYGIPSFAGDNGYYNGGAEVKNGKLSLPIPANAATIEGNVGTVIVPVTTDNYETMNLTFPIEAKNRIEPTGEPILDRYQITYGAKIGSINFLSDKLRDKENMVDVTGLFAWNQPDADTVPDAGTCLAGWNFTPSGETAYMYKPVAGDVTITVNKAAFPSNKITVLPKSIDNLVYNGEEMALITAGKTEIGTMEYRIGENGEWQTEIPTAILAGDYDVYYRATGDGNYEKSEPVKVSCSIAKRPVTISNKEEGGYPLTYMYGNRVLKPTDSYFDITGSEGVVDFTYQWLDGDPENNPELGEYKLLVTVGETANTMAGSFGMTVKIVRNTNFEQMGGRGYYVYNNSGTVSYDIDFTQSTGIDISTLAVKNLTVKVKGNDGQLIDYDEETCDFKINVKEGENEKKGTLHVKLTGLDKPVTGLSFCTVGIFAQDVHYADLYTEVRLEVKEKEPQTLGVAMSGFTYGDPASTPVYTAPEGTLESSVTYAKKDGTPLAKAPTEAGDYTVTVVCETKDTIYSGLADYTIARKPVTADVTVNGTYTYNQTPIEPTEVVVKDGETVIPSGEYSLSFDNNIDAGTATVTVSDKDGGNYAVSGTGTFTIDKATVLVRPKDISKVYGEEAVPSLWSDSPLIQESDLAEMAKTPGIFSSEGIAKTAPVIDGGYVLTVDPSQCETKNLIFRADGAATITVNKAPLTVKVKNVSREYGAENPALEVEYSGFIPGEDESVLDGTLELSYDNRIHAEAAVGTYEKAAQADGLSSGNYAITYLPGDVVIEEIAVTMTAGTARSTYLTIELDRPLAGLTVADFTVTDSEGQTVSISRATASADQLKYTLAGNFAVGSVHTVTLNLDQTPYHLTHKMVNPTLTITPQSGGGGGSNVSGIGGGGGGNVIGRYTVTFETNGGSRIEKQSVTKGTLLSEPFAPTKEGYAFAGWYTDKDLKEKYDFSQTVTKNLTLYAAWTEAEEDLSARQMILTIGEKEAMVFGERKTNDVAPQIVNDRTMLPARFVAENLGAKVEWNGETEVVTIRGNNLKDGTEVTIVITIGSDLAYVNGKEYRLDSPAFVENDRTYTPIRFISEELGASVDWIESEQKVVITKQGI